MNTNLGRMCVRPSVPWAALPELLLIVKGFMEGMGITWILSCSKDPSAPSLLGMIADKFTSPMPGMVPLALHKILITGLASPPKEESSEHRGLGEKV